MWEMAGGRIAKTSPTARWMGRESESVRWSWKNLEWNSQMETRDISEADAKQKVESWGVTWTIYIAAGVSGQKKHPFKYFWGFLKITVKDIVPYVCFFSISLI